MVVVLVVITVAVTLALRLASLGYPGEHVFDEVYYAKDAKALLDGRLGATDQQRLDDLAWEPGDEVSWPHPGMGKLAIAAGVAVLGDDSWGWRIVPALAGTILIGLVYPLARRFRLPRAWALAALVLAASDMLLLAQSRIATLDVFVGLWTALCVYLALRYVQDGHRWWWLALCGLAGGMAVGTKWSGALALVAAAVILVVYRRRQPETSGVDRALDALVTIALAVVFLVALPAAIYVASYTPYFTQGHSLGDWLELQRQMKIFNFGLHAEHSYASPAYKWILDWRPVWYFYEGEPNVRGIVALGNPLLWWASIPAVVGLLIAGFVRRPRRGATSAGSAEGGTDGDRAQEGRRLGPAWWIFVATVAFEVFGWLRLAIAFRSAGRQWDALSPTSRDLFYALVAVLVVQLVWLLLRGDSRLVLPPFLVLLLYLPWLGTGRTSFLYYMTPVVPFMAICLALALALLAGPVLIRCRWAALSFVAGALGMYLFWRPLGRAGTWLLWDLPGHVSRGAAVATVGAAAATVAALVVVVYVVPRLRPAWRYLSWGYVGLVTGTCVVFLPILLARSISSDEFYRLMWFTSWI